MLVVQSLLKARLVWWQAQRRHKHRGAADRRVCKQTSFHCLPALTWCAC